MGELERMHTVVIGAGAFGFATAYQLAKAGVKDVVLLDQYEPGTQVSATGVGGRLPVVAAPLHGAAGVVAYSRVHTGVHHPLDVLVGWIVGTLLAQLTTRFAGGLAARAVGRVSGRAGRARAGSWPARGTARGRAAA